MKRAAVLIGVDRTGRLPRLNDAARGARQMEAWAQSQQFDVVRLLTDENGAKVGPGVIKQAINEIITPGDVEQLVVYFAGHGVNIRYGEYWLLSDAPDDSNAAVNVQSSVELARYCGIPHVVLLSDACRTAAAGIQAQYVNGSEIFPNGGVGGQEMPVDQFFACTLGRPAYEVADPNVTTKEFSALYTAVLTEALNGQDSAATDPDGFVRPRKLKTRLAEAVTSRIAAMNLATRLIQVPDARITSDPQAWISKPGTANRGAPIPVPGAPPGGSAPTPMESLIRSALGQPVIASVQHFAPSADKYGLAASIGRMATPFGPSHYETGCGFKVRGKRVVEAFSVGPTTELIPGGEAIRVSPHLRSGATVVLVFEDQSGVALPAIREYLAGLTFEDDELADVAYEPADTSWRWGEFQARSSEVRSLRAVAASATRNGVFQLEGEDAGKMATRMQFAKGLDPTLAVYAAYAYLDLGERVRITKMSSYMRDDIGGCLFDIALLAGKLTKKESGKQPDVYSATPLLAQGWGLLAAHNVRIPKSLGDFKRTLLPSTWTLFNGEGVARMKEALQKGEML